MFFSYDDVLVTSYMSHNKIEKFDMVNDYEMFRTFVFDLIC